MDALNAISVNTPYGVKTLSIHCCDICEWSDPLDVMTISSFVRGYRPTPGTLLGALHTKGVSIQELARSPLIGLRDCSHARRLVLVCAELGEPGCRAT